MGCYAAQARPLGFLATELSSPWNFICGILFLIDREDSCQCIRDRKTLCKGQKDTFLRDRKTLFCFGQKDTFFLFQTERHPLHLVCNRPSHCNFFLSNFLNIFFDKTLHIYNLTAKTNQTMTESDLKKCIH